MVVWKPADPADFNGTVFVEWLNVSPGFDNPPDWLNSHNHFVREGAIWIGVSAQAASVRGRHDPDGGRGFASSRWAQGRRSRALRLARAPG